MTFFERRFKLSAHGTTVPTEVLAGVTTFLTMAYIVFVQPAVLSAAGMDFGAVMVATCLSTPLATTLMTLSANYPIAVAPAMGHNFFFAYSVVVGMKVPWQVALGAVAVAGTVFVLTAGIGLPERLITAIPASLQHAIAAGIGLLIAMVGLQCAGLIVASPGTLVALGDLHSRPVVVTLAGLVVTAVLMARRVTGALLFAPSMIAVVFVFFFLALFDSVGTLVGVGQQAGQIRQRRRPGGGRRCWPTRLEGRHGARSGGASAAACVRGPVRAPLCISARVTRRFGATTTGPAGERGRRPECYDVRFRRLKTSMDVQVYKEMLLKKRGEILGAGGIKPLQASMENNTRQGDMADQASGNNEVHIQLKLKQTDAKILQAIEEALWRIEKGTYGVCRDCGEPIAEARLKAIPWTRVCITCKEKQGS